MSDTNSVSSEQFATGKVRPDQRAFMFPLGRIDPNLNQMRRRDKRGEPVQADLDRFEEAGKSIRVNRVAKKGNGSGILLPIVVSFPPGSFDANGIPKPNARARIEDGEGRYYGAYAAGLTNEDPVPIIVEETFDDVDDLVAGLHANIIRVDPNPRDVAARVYAIKVRGKYTIEELVEKTGKPKSWVQKNLDLWRLPTELDVLIDETDESVQLATRINTVKQDDLRLFLIKMRLDGASTRLIETVIPLRHAPNEGFYRAMLTWLVELWNGAQENKTPVDLEDFKSAFRREGQRNGYSLVKGLKNMTWATIPQQAPPVLNDEGEFTGFSHSTVEESPALSDSEEEPEPTLNLTPTTHTATVVLPRENVLNAVDNLAPYYRNLIHVVEVADQVPDSQKILRSIAERREQMQQLEDSVRAKTG